MKLKQLLIALMLMALATTAGAQQMILQKAVIAAGGGISSGLVLKSNITIGQAVTGTASNGTTNAQIGFWSSSKTQATGGVTEHVADIDMTLKMWPNPANKLCKILVTSASANEVDLRLFDLTGKEVKLLYSGALTSQAIACDLSGLAAGSYILAARAPGQMVEKVISVIR